MQKQKSLRDVYQLLGLPAGVFGETYVVVTAIELAPNRFLSEQFVLTQRPNQALYSGAFEIDGTNLPAELGKVDLDFAFAEGRTHAEFLVSQLLEIRANELGRPDLVFNRVEFTDRPSTFVGCKMRGRFVPQFLEIKKATKCDEFSRYLTLLEQVAVTG